LASRMSLEVPRAVLMNADTAGWERNVTRKVQRAMSELDTDGALALLSERSERTTSSPLFALEAKAWMLRKDYSSALQAVERGIDQVSTSNNRGRLAELPWLKSQICLPEGDPPGADRALERAERTIEHATDRLPLMHVLCHRLLLREQYPGKYRESATRVRSRLNEIGASVSEWNEYSSLFVARLAANLLAAEFPRTSRHLGGLVGERAQAFAGALTSDNLQGIDPYREPWEIEGRPEAEVSV
jgi:hypothetical protein